MSTPYDIPKDISNVNPFEWNDRYDFPRDLVGYGEESFNPQWPNGAKIAVSFVINYEEVYSPPPGPTAHLTQTRVLNTQFSMVTCIPRPIYGKQVEAVPRFKNEL